MASKKTLSLDRSKDVLCNKAVRIYKKVAHWDIAIPEHSPLAPWEDSYRQQYAKYYVQRSQPWLWDCEIVLSIKHFEAGFDFLRTKHQDNLARFKSSIDSGLNLETAIQNLIDSLSQDEPSTALYDAACILYLYQNTTPLSDAHLRRHSFIRALKEVGSIYNKEQVRHNLDDLDSLDSGFNQYFTHNFEFKNEHLLSFYQELEANATGNSQYLDVISHWHQQNPSLQLTKKELCIAIAISKIYQQGYKELQSPSQEQLKAKWHLVEELADSIAIMIEQRQQAEREREQAVVSDTFPHSHPHHHHSASLAPVPPPSVIPIAHPAQATSQSQLALESSTAIPSGSSEEQFCRTIKETIQSRHPSWTQLEVNPTSIKLNNEMRTTIHPVENSRHIVMTNVKIPPSADDISIMADVMIASATPVPKIKNGSITDVVTLAEKLVQEDTQHVIQGLELSDALRAKLAQDANLQQRYDAALATLNSRYQPRSELHVETRATGIHSRL